MGTPPKCEGPYRPSYSTFRSPSLLIDEEERQADSERPPPPSSEQGEVMRVRIRASHPPFASCYLRCHPQVDGYHLQRSLGGSSTDHVTSGYCLHSC